MELRVLQYFLAVAREQNISAAAQSLHLTQPTLSRQLRELEEELGIQFFVRSNRGVEFTPEGKEFLSYAVSLLEQKRGIESLYGEARNAAAPVRFSVSCQRYPLQWTRF